MVDVMNDLVDRSPIGPLRRRRRPRAPLPRPDHLRSCSARPARTGSSSRVGRRHLQSVQLHLRHPRLEPVVMRAWRDRRLRRRHGRPRRHSLTDDLLSDLIRAEDDGDRLMPPNCACSRAACCSRVPTPPATRWPPPWTCSASTLISGSCSSNPDLAMRAVEETMRHSPIAGGTLRLVVDDVELDGRHLPRRHHGAGEHAAANRDPSDLRRPGSLRHHPRGSPAILPSAAACTTAWAPIWPGGRSPKR